MVFLSVFWLNAFPHKHGVSPTISPRTIVTGKHIDYKIHCKVEYGQYVQTHEKHNNNMETRTVGALALRPTDNAQGGYYFYSLVSGKRLNRTHWTKLPMPTSVKDRVHALARRANAGKGLVFHDSDGNDLDVLYPSDTADDADPNYDPADEEQSYESDKDSDYIPDGDTVTDELADPTLVNEGVDDDDDANDDDDADNDAENDDNNDANDDVENAEDNEHAEEDEHKNEHDENNGDHPGMGDVPGVEGTTRLATAAEATERGDLEEFVDGLKNELDAEIAEIDSEYIPNDNGASDDDLDTDIEEIDNGEEAELLGNSAREQSTADMNAGESDDEEDMHPLIPADDSDSDSDSDEDTAPLPRFRRNRGLSYAHLKGREGDGSLPTVARPEEFGAS
jgi:hypothetical protein